RGQVEAPLELAALLAHEGRALEAIALAGAEQVPGQHGKLAGDGDERDLRAAPPLDAAEERPQRSGPDDRSVRGLDEQAAGVGVSSSADVPGPGLALAGLMHLRIE